MVFKVFKILNFNYFFLFVLVNMEPYWSRKFKTSKLLSQFSSDYSYTLQMNILLMGEYSRSYFLAIFQALKMLRAFLLKSGKIWN